MTRHIGPFGRVAFGVAFFVLFARTAWPAVPARTTSKLSIPFSATVRSPFDNEDVDIAGHVLVTVTIIRTTDPFKVSVTARLASDVTAVGKTTSLPFVAKGTSHLNYFWPSNPTRLTHTIPLHLYSPPSSVGSPVQRVWLLQYQVGYGAAGQVTSMDATMVPDPASESCSTVVEVCQ
jgi:hypothetical protein